MWFRFKRQAVPSRQAVLESPTRPNRLTLSKRGGRVSLVLETLEDRFAPATLVKTLHAPDAFAAQTGGVFGSATATNEDYHVVSMPAAHVDSVDRRGAAFVYSATSGDLISTLINPRAANDRFGSRGAIALSGSRVVVGAWGLDDDTGRAYVFDAATGNLISTLFNPTPATDDFFGWSVAISGDTVVVGARNDSTVENSSGQAYVFNATTGALIATLANPSPGNSDLFGSSMAVSGNTLIVGAPRDDTGASNSGQAYVFDLTTTALIAILTNPSPASDDEFGTSVAIAGNTIVVGAANDDAGGTDSGRAYIFDATTGALVATLTNPSPASFDRFGERVAAFGNSVVVAAPYHDTTGQDSGEVYVFDARTGELLDTLSNPLPASDGLPSEGSGDQFGRVSIWGNTVVVGANYDDTEGHDQGAAYIFDIGEVVNRPRITSVAPFVGPTTGDIPVVIKGVNFLGVTGPAGVRFGANNATSYTVDSDTQITAVLPPGNGLVDIYVTNAGVTSAAGATSKFQYTSTAATVRFVVTGPTSVPANTAFSITVTALDAFGNIAVAYTGTVRITNSVSGNKMPANYKFTAADKGVLTFTGIKLKQRGQHTLTVTDTLTSSIVGTWTITVT